MPTGTPSESELPGFLSLPTDKLLLALCIRQENLTDPDRWCEELREYERQSRQPGLTVADVERLWAWRGRLTMEAEGVHTPGPRRALTAAQTPHRVVTERGFDGGALKRLLH